MRRSDNKRCVGMVGGGERVTHVLRSKGRGAARALRRRHVALARCRASTLAGPVTAATVAVVVAVCRCAVVSHAVSTHTCTVASPLNRNMSK